MHEHIFFIPQPFSLIWVECHCVSIYRDGSIPRFKERSLSVARNVARSGKVSSSRRRPNSANTWSAFAVQRWTQIGTVSTEFNVPLAVCGSMQVTIKSCVNISMNFVLSIVQVILYLALLESNQSPIKKVPL
jgi:hypothetical protein